MTAKHTPGPWVMASAQSSVVGWPVTSSTGRVICNINYVHHSVNDPAVPGDRAFNAESKANARLIAAAPDMLPIVRAVAAIWLADEVEDGAHVIGSLTAGDVRRARAALSKAESRE